jgi:hypothetical protein
VISTVAGTGSCYYNGDGPALTAHLNQPYGIAVDAEGGLLIADHANCLIRRLKDGQLTTLVGMPRTMGDAVFTECGYNTDDSPGTATMIGNPMGVAAGRDGNAYFTEIPFTSDAPGRVRVIYGVTAPATTPPPPGSAVPTAAGALRPVEEPATPPDSSAPEEPGEDEGREATDGDYSVVSGWLLALTMIAGVAVVAAALLAATRVRLVRRS